MAIGRDLAFGIRHARGGVKLNAVNNIAAIAGQFDAINGLGIGRARFGKLTRHATDFDDRQLGTIGQHNRHLQQYAERIADIVGVVLNEAFGAIAALQQKRTSLAYLSELRFQIARFTGNNQRRKARQAIFHRLQGCRIVISRHLLNRKIPPAFQSPFRVHHYHPSRV